MVLIILRNGGICILFSLWLLFSNAQSGFETFFEELEKIGSPINESTTAPSQTNNTKEIVNVTCILDKYGMGYIGTHNMTYDGLPCVEWSRNALLYARYKLRGENISENYCRNPDGDTSGPWCFVSNRSVFKRHFKFKRCGIPLCQSKIPHPIHEIHVGVRMLLKRECPFGFKLTILERAIVNNTFCEVEQEFLSKLPKGPYSLELANIKNNTICPEDFKMEYVPLRGKYCTRTDSTNDIIEMPKYLFPKPGELIFIAYKIGKDAACPQMSEKTSVMIRKQEMNRMSPFFILSKSGITMCHYFHKLSNNKITGSVDRRLGILVLQKNCPKDWTIKLMSFKWRFHIKTEGSYKRQSFYVCIPNKDVQKYPDGDYCLLSLNNNNICPEEFIDVDMKINGIINTKFCCAQSRKPENSNQIIYDFFNVSSLLIINSANKCEKTSNKDIIVKQYTFEALLYKEKFECTNCDLFEVFITNEYNFGRRWLYFKNQFKVCSYEKATSGFAYSTLNSRCPPNMNYAYIKYAKSKYMSLNSAKVVASFCTILNYPKNISFPKGQYCIYKLGSDCPPGFQNVKSKLPLYFYKYSDSGGDITNYQLDNYCCKFGSKNISFENATLPYVTPNFEFGLPYANGNFSCIHGLETHTATEDSHMCHYYPTTDKSPRISIVFTSNNCDYRTYRHYGKYRFIYSSLSNIPYCNFFVNDRPPPGNYCASFTKTCPPAYFDYITYHPLMKQVICCRKPIQNDTQDKESEYTASGWVNDLKSFSLLPYKKVCPIFQRYNYGKEPIKRYYYYTASDISEDHKRNLTKIGFDVTRVLKGYSVSMYSCDYKLDPHNKSVTWPHGQYAFPKPLSGCPSNFKSGEFTHSMETANPSFAHSETIHLDGDYMIGGSTIKWGFCVKKDNYIKDKLYLPYGRYCLMKVDYSCPQSFREGSVKFVEITALNKSLIRREGVLPKIETEGLFITYHFCCQSGRGDVAHEPMYLPTESGSFFLLKYGTYCQKVYGMRFTEEFICIDSEDSSQYLNYTFHAPYNAEGATPVSGSFIRGCDFQINLCYYELDKPISTPLTPKPGPLVNWPVGSYIFLKPLQRVCPFGFDEGAIIIQMLYKLHPKFIHSLLFGTLDKDNAIYSYCKRNSSAVDKLRPAEDWPAGNYCLIFEKKCPPGMLRLKTRSLDNLILKKQSGAQMAQWSNLCCQKDRLSNLTTLPYFPGDYYTFLIQPSRDLYACPPHQNARVALVDLRSEILCIYERLDEGVEFPDGDYLLPDPPAPMNICAPGFKLVEHRHTPLMDDDNNLKMKKLKFCQKESKGFNNGTFPRGNYCILTTSDGCPSSQFSIENVLIIPLYHFEGQQHKYSRYLACCQRDEKIISNIVIPKVPFALYGSSPCSYVDGFPAVWESEEETLLVQSSGLGKPPFNKDQKKLQICKYDQISAWNIETKCNCHQNASCAPFLEDNSCFCLPGYFGDGKIFCTKITNETDKCANVCDKNASVCSKSSSSDGYSCICKEGYEGNGFKCVPSCKTRSCGAFSQCKTNELESFCVCNPTAIEVDKGRCHGDIINTMYHLTGFDMLYQVNLSCLSKVVYNYLVEGKTDRTLFLFVPVINNMVSSTCDFVHCYYGFTWRKFRFDVNFQVHTRSNHDISVVRNEDNVWIVEEKYTAIFTDVFTNAVVLYLNGSLNFTDIFPPPQPITTEIKGKTIAGFVLGGVLLFFLLIILLFVINRKRSTFARLYETRSESNIHFIPADDKIEMES